MAELLNSHNLASALTALLQLVLLFHIARQRVYRLYPLFSAYVLVATAQNIFLVWSARHWGPASMQYFNIAWGTQAAVVFTRWLAVLEIARRILGGYSGIWKMASRVLFFLGALSLAYALALARFRWDLAVLNADRAVELCIAVFIVGMLLFAKYYRLEMTSIARQLAIGFALYSCAWVIDNSVVLQSHRLAALWVYSQTVAFLASLVVWIGAVRRPAEVPQAVKVPGLSAEDYELLSRQLNTRLVALNERLNQLFHSEDSRP